MGSDFSVTPLKGRESAHGRQTDQGYTIDAAAVDAGSTPTTTLRKLLVMAIITATGKLIEYDSGGSGGQEIPAGLLKDTVDMTAETVDCLPEEKPGVLMTHAEVNAPDCPGLDYDAQQALTHIVFRNPLDAPPP